MFHVVLVLHIFLCILLVGLTLLQQGKGADAGAAFGGGGSSNSLFGASGATSMIVKVTTGIAIAFFFTSVALIKLYNTQARNTVGITAKSSSLIEQLAEEGKKPAEAAAPAAPVAPAPVEPAKNIEKTAEKK
jgi:preprotein translocase subunit SecG